MIIQVAKGPVVKCSGQPNMAGQAFDPSGQDLNWMVSEANIQVLKRQSSSVVVNHGLLSL